MYGQLQAGLSFSQHYLCSSASVDTFKNGHLRQSSSRVDCSRPLGSMACKQGGEFGERPATTQEDGKSVTLNLHCLCHAPFL
jgi:hypothetical protein